MTKDPAYPYCFVVVVLHSQSSDLLTELQTTVSLSAGKEAARKPTFFPLVLFNNDDNNLN